MVKGKVFILGFQKTGTTSFEVLLKMLGYKVFGGDKNVIKLSNNDEIRAYIKELMKNYDALQDMPWPLFYNELYELFPNAKFVLTYRNSDKWFDSVIRYFGSIRIPMHKTIYGVPCAEGYKETYVSLYEKTNKEILEFFKEKQNFISIDLSKGYTIEEFVNFLEINSELKGPFPKARANKRRYHKIKLFRDLISFYWNVRKGY